MSGPLTAEAVEQVRQMLEVSAAGYPDKNVTLLLGTARALLATLDRDRAALASPSLDAPSVLDPVHKAREEGYMRGYDDGKRAASASPSLHRLLMPPHPGDIYQSSALCSCGDFQFDADSPQSLIDKYRNILRDHAAHEAAAIATGST